MFLVTILHLFVSQGEVAVVTTYEKCLRYQVYHLAKLKSRIVIVVMLK